MRFLWLCLLTLPLLASEGVMPIGYGPKAKGMGGVGIAYPQESFTIAMNPAGLGCLRNRVDMGVWGIYHQGKFGVIATTDPSQNATNEWTVWPEGGITWQCGNLAFGMAIYQEGFWRVDFNQPIAQFGTTPLKSSFLQYAASPAVAWRPHPCHWVGLAVSFCVAKLKINGLEEIADNSIEPNLVTNNGNSWAYGASGRLGWLCRPVDWITVGAAYQTHNFMGGFDQYRGFIPGGGKIELPSQLGFGVAWRLFCKTWMSIDVVKVFWREARVFENQLTQDNDTIYGADNGPGLGWDEQLALKVGLCYRPRPWVALRAGYYHANTQIAPQDGFLNATNMQGVENHLTFGATVRARCSELSVYYLHGFRHTINGFLIQDLRTDLVTRQNAIGVAYGRDF